MISPIRPDDETLSQLQSLGNVKHIVAPNLSRAVSDFLGNQSPSPHDDRKSLTRMQRGNSVFERGCPPPRIGQESREIYLSQESCHRMSK